MLLFGEYMKGQTLMKNDLLKLGWIDKGDVLVRYSNPRLGWKEDGTLIIGYHEYPKKITSVKQLKTIINGLR